MPRHPGERSNINSDTIRPLRSLKQVLVPKAVVVAVMLAASSAGFAPAFAQAPGIPNALEQLPGLNDAQRKMAISTDNACIALHALPISSLASEQRSLRARCSGAVNNANTLAGRQAVYQQEPGQEPGTVGTPNWNLPSSSALASALQRMAGEEAQAPRALIMRGQTGQLRAVQQRMAALRTRVAPLGVVQVDIDSPTWPRQYANLDPTGIQMVQANTQEPVYFGPWGAFLLGSVFFGNQDPTSQIGGFSYDSYTITTGADYRVTDNLIVGLALGFNHFETDFDVNANTAPNERLNNDSYYFSLYSTYYLPNEFYVEGTASFAHSSFNSRRLILIPEAKVPIPINDIATADYGGTQFGLSFGAGHDWSLAPVTLNLSGHINYARANIDSYDEKGGGEWNLAFNGQIIDSLTTRLDLQVSYAISTNFGVLLPYARAGWTHEFLGSENDIGFRYLNAPDFSSQQTITPLPTDRNYFPLGAGVSATLPNGWAAFLHYEALVGIKDFSANLVTVGLRKEF